MSSMYNLYWDLYSVQLEAAKVIFGVYVQYVRPAGART